MSTTLFNICDSCYRKLYWLGIELEIVTVGPIFGNCWMCNMNHEQVELNLCVKPLNMKEEE